MCRWPLPPCAAPAGPEQSRAMPVRHAPYSTWSGSLPDPREATLAERADALAAIVETEGPVLAIRAYRCLVRSSGGKQVTALVRGLLDEAVEELVTSERLLIHGETGPDGLSGGVLRCPATAPVCVRTRGPRDLEEIPLDEVAAVIEDIWSRAPLAREEALKRIVLDRFDLVRLTPGVSAHLDRAVAAATDPRSGTV